MIKTFHVAAVGPRAAARSLSGGGVDAGAVAGIHRDLIALADAGTAILVVSQDLDELFAICDRIAVICHGRLSAAQSAHASTVEDTGMLMGGVFHLDETKAGDHATAT